MKNHSSVKINDSLFWVGALDYDIRVFDVIMHTDYGTTYNSYVLKGSEKTVLFDITKYTFYHEFLNRLHSVIDPAEIDYIMVHHTEPDHSSSLMELIEFCPNATILGSASAINFLKGIINKEFKYEIVHHNDEISLGDKTLKFISVPFLHWPDSMYTYVKEEKTLFTCDSFGRHYCMPEDKLYDDLIDDNFYESFKYYYDCIMSPYKNFVIKALDKIQDLDIEMICTGHGPVLRKDIDKYISLYREWSTPKVRVKPSVVILYVSAYGYTKTSAKRIADGVKASGDVDVILFDIMEISKDVIVKQIEECSGLILGSPTILNDALPPVWQILIELNPVIHGGKLGAAFGSYGWSGEAITNIEQRLKQLKFDIPVNGLRIYFNPSNEELNQCFEFGKEFGTKMFEKLQKKQLKK